MIEAPVKEPRDLDGPGGVRVEVVSRSFGEVQRPVWDVDARSAARGRCRRRSQRLRQDDAARADLRPPASPTPARVQAAPAALMPQRDLLLPWLSAIDNAGLALRARGVSRAEARAAAAPWLERFGLAGFEQSRPAALSGGMRQRVSFLRTLLAGKPVLALDEPFAALDAITRVEMQGWLAMFSELEPRTVVLVTHDVEEAVMLADRVVVMSARPGRTVAEIAVELPRPRRGSIRPSSRCASRRSRRWGVDREARERGRAAARCCCSCCSGRGSCTSISVAPTR